MTKTRDHKTKSKLPLYSSILMIVILVVAYFTVPSVESFIANAWDALTSGSEQKAKEWVAHFGWGGTIVLEVAMIVQMFLLVIPTLLLMVVSILAYGPVWGSLLILVSVFAASSVGYAIGSYLGGDFIDSVLRHKSGENSKEFLKSYGFWFIVITRINPFLSNDAISFIAGLLKMGYWKFIGLSLLGIAPLTIFIAVLGKMTDNLTTGLFWISLVSLVIFITFIYWDKRKRKVSD